MKRLSVTLSLVILVLLGMHWTGVNQVYAGTEKTSRIEPAISRNAVFSGQSSLSLGEFSMNPAISAIYEQSQGNITGKLMAANLLNRLPLAVRSVLSSSSIFASKIPHKVSLYLTGSSQYNLSQPITLSGGITDLYTGLGIPNKTVRFTYQGIYLGQTHTDNQGVFVVKINKDLPAGSYLVTATFKGAHLLEPASNVVSFEILPATVLIETIPATAGITFQMDGHQFESGPDGSASININKVGLYRLDVLLDQYNNPSQQVEFGRWTQETFQPFQNISVPAESSVQVGLNIFHRISLKFVDLDGFPVDPKRITSISIRSIQGDIFTLKPGDTPWLPASRTARRQTGLDVSELLYSVNDVTIDGSNVVNSAQQRFFARTDDTWTISLLLYSVKISSRDGVFATPVGTSVNVLYPDGQTKNYPLDKTGNLEIHALARGIYHISVLGVTGLGTSTPVALSRNQLVNLNIVTRLDVAAFGLVSIGLAAGLIFYGRPWLLLLILRRKRSSSRKLGWKSVNEN